MDVRDFLHVVRVRWSTVALVALAGLAVGVVAVWRAPVEYAATTSLFVSVQSDGASAVELGQGSTAAQQKVRSYVDVVTSQRVLQPVIDRLGLRTSVAALAARIRASASQNTVIIGVTVTDTAPRRAARIANAVGASLREVVSDQLEQPLGGGRSPVRIETIGAATPPSAPSAPDRGVYVGLGATGGLLAGLTLALLQHTLDTRIRSTRDVESVSTAPVLGEIAWDDDAAEQPLTAHGDGLGARAESFRALRTSLVFVDLRPGRRSVVVTSAMPNEGKTTSSANLAVALAENGARVVLVDADLRRPRLAEVMGIEGAVGVTDLLVGRAEIDDVAQPWGHDGLTVIPAGATPPNPSELLGSDAMRTLVATLEDTHDWVLIDSPPLLPVTDAAVLSKLTSGALVVTAADRTRRPQLERALASLDAIGARVLGVVLTMVQHDAVDGYGYGYAHERDDAPDHQAATAPDRRPSRRRSGEVRPAAVRADLAATRPPTTALRPGTARPSRGRTTPPRTMMRKDVAP